MSRSANWRPRSLCAPNERLRHSTNARSALWTFVEREGVEPTNNHAERETNVSERLGLTYRILDRWISAHAEADHLDLELSNYVAREALGLAGAAAKGGGPPIPKSLLYDFAQLRSVIVEARAMTAAQFAALQAAGVTHVASPVANAEPLPINFDWIASLCEAPDVEWERAVGNKNVRPFEAAFQLSGRPRSEVLKHVFGISDQKMALGLDGVLSSTTTIVFTTALAIAQVVNPGYAIAAAAVAAFTAMRESSDAAAKDAARELVLYAADVARVRLLSDAWELIDQCVRVTADRALLALDIGGRAAPRLIDTSGHAELASGPVVTLQRFEPLLAADGARLVREPRLALP